MMDCSEGSIAPHLAMSQFETPLGSMVAIADDNHLHLLKFADQQSLDRAVKQLIDKTRATIIHRRTHPLIALEKEIAAYFQGNLRTFQTPIHLHGTPFEKHAWTALMNVPYGQTLSYAQQAIAIGRPSAHRAVANANGANKLAIIIPCHRIINSNGNLGGYDGNSARKKWLLEFEKRKRELL